MVFISVILSKDGGTFQFNHNMALSAYIYWHQFIYDKFDHYQCIFIEGLCPID